jgi:hypothetical protein
MHVRRCVHRWCTLLNFVSYCGLPYCTRFAGAIFMSRRRCRFRVHDCLRRVRQGRRAIGLLGGRRAGRTVILTVGLRAGNWGDNRSDVLIRGNRVFFLVLAQMHLDRVLRDRADGVSNGPAHHHDQQRTPHDGGGGVLVGQPQHNRRSEADQRKTRCDHL